MYNETNKLDFDTLTTASWEVVKNKSKEIFKDFPFLKDPDFTKLRPSFQKFIMAYSLKDFKGWYLRDCYRYASGNYDTSNMSCSASANRVMKNENVSPFLKKIDLIRLGAMGYSAERIIEEELAIAYSDLSEYMDEDGMCLVRNIRELPPTVRRAIKSFTEVTYEDDEGRTRKKLKLKLWDKGTSLGRLQKVKGMNAAERLKVEGGLTVTHEHKIDLSDLSDKELAILGRIIKKKDS